MAGFNSWAAMREGQSRPSKTQRRPKRFRSAVSLIRWDSDGMATLHVSTGQMPHFISARPLEVLIAAADESDESYVEHGENEGRTLKHVAVLRSLTRVGTHRWVRRIFARGEGQTPSRRQGRQFTDRGHRARGTSREGVGCGISAAFELAVSARRTERLVRHVAGWDWTRGEHDEIRNWNIGHLFCAGIYASKLGKQSNRLTRDRIAGGTESAGLCCARTNLAMTNPSRH